jgi:prepilin-type N-terminal cleavage/methylation domain-containing protein
MIGERAASHSSFGRTRRGNMRRGSIPQCDIRRSPIGRRRSPRRGPGARAGFTLVELVVAMMLFTVGLLALASGAGGVVRLMDMSNRQTLAATMAKSRFETLRSTSCATLASGSSTTRGMTETWTVSPYANQGFTARVTVSYKQRRGTTRQVVLGTVISCR